MLSRILWEKPGKSIPLIYCHCIGFIGWIRVQLKEHTVVESHPDSVIDDLRLDCPFPEMLDYFNSMTLESREDAIRTPWLPIFYKMLEKFVHKKGQEETNSNITGKNNPFHLNLQQKREFKEFLEAGMKCTKISFRPNSVV